MSDKMTAADIFTPRHTPPICEVCGFNLNFEGICEECGFDAYALEMDEDDGVYEDDFEDEVQHE